MLKGKGKTCLYDIFFRRLSTLDKFSKRGIIPFPVVFEKLCLVFSINKKECWDALFTIRDAGYITIVPFHGIRLSKNGDK